MDAGGWTRGAGVRAFVRDGEAMHGEIIVGISNASVRSDGFGKERITNR